MRNLLLYNVTNNETNLLIKINISWYLAYFRCRWC